MRPLLAQLVAMCPEGMSDANLRTSRSSALLALSSPALAAGGPSVTSLPATQSGSKVSVKIKTKGFKIDAQGVGTAPKSGAGHEHFAMDNGKYDYEKYAGANGKIASQFGVQGKYSPSVNNKVVYTGLPRRASTASPCSWSRTRTRTTRVPARRRRSPSPSSSSTDLQAWTRGRRRPRVFASEEHNHAIRTAITAVAGKIEHTVTDSTKSGTIGSKIIRLRPLKHGQALTVRFRKRGTVYYICIFHPDLMRGVVTVR
jgi:hypothetical protein